MRRADIDIRVSGRVGRITLTRENALNALSHDMCLAIESALDAWRDDPSVAMLLLDAKGERAFCAGGDIVEMYESGMRGDYEYGRRFWRDEYRMNAKMFEFPKPVVSLMQGFTMGGGVGFGCHASHRVVGDSSRIAMPEAGIGLVPDVGGSLLLARAPGRLGAYLGTTCTRMGAADAIYAGFADYYLPENQWGLLTGKLISTGDWSQVDAHAQTPPDSPIRQNQAEIDSAFGGGGLHDILNALQDTQSKFATGTLKALGRNSPLSMAVLVEMTHRLRGLDDIRRALELEYRFTYRAMQHGDFLEGIRAAIIDKDRTPVWRHADMWQVSALDVANMLRPLGKEALNLQETRP
ncbi:MAG: enoyl-CoA hydratase/isomerase family protein [Halocynthiibacter sp.]